MFGKLEAVRQGWGAEGRCGREVGDGAGKSGRAPRRLTEQTALELGECGRSLTGEIGDHFSIITSLSDVKRRWTTGNESREQGKNHNDSARNDKAGELMRSGKSSRELA